MAARELLYLTGITFVWNRAKELKNLLSEIPENINDMKKQINTLNDDIKSKFYGPPPVVEPNPLYGGYTLPDGERVKNSITIAQKTNGYTPFNAFSRSW